MEQRVWQGLSIVSAYTFGKVIDSGGAGQNMYDRRPERGLADNDIRHNFIAGFVDDLPIGKGRTIDIQNSVLNAIIGGWQLNGIVNMRTGAPFSISTAGDIARVGSGSQRANATGLPSAKIDPRVNGLIGLDRAAYSTPALGTFGTAARNTQPGFGVNQWDVSLAKNFALSPLGENGKLQLRFEWFNFFNHTQFFNPIATQNAATFGRVTAAADPRILQIAGRIAMVTRRSALGALLAAPVSRAAAVKITAIESFAVQVPDGGARDPLACLSLRRHPRHDRRRRHRNILHSHPARPP